MSRKIQFHTFHLLFSLFSYLADKSGGWSMFVRPKLVIGGLIVGLGMTACNVKNSNKSESISIDPKIDSLKKSQCNYDPENDTATSCYIVIDSSQIPYFKNEDYEPFIVVEQMPEFPGGSEIMMEFLNKNLVYPKEVFNDNISGMVICSFMVDKNGSISDVSVVRGIHPLLDKEAIRVIKVMPKWNPGKQGGKAVPVKFTLPIRFSMPNKKQ